MKTGLSSVNMDVKDFDFVRELGEIYFSNYVKPSTGRQERRAARTTMTSKREYYFFSFLVII